jgi:predicted membrane channel-forming protein YqfA (hemolysin III family)
MSRLRRIANTLLPLALVWIALIVVAFVLDADWPDTNRLDFVLVCCIASFDVLLATTILRRMHGIDLLTIALAGVFYSKACIWFYAAGGRLWPEWYASHSSAIPNLIRVSIAVTLGIATVLVLMTEDGSEAHDAPVTERL